MTNMAAMPIYDKTLKIFSGTKRPMTLKVCIQHWVLEYYQVCLNGVPRLTLFYGKVKLVPCVFVWEKKVEQRIFQKLF